MQSKRSSKSSQTGSDDETKSEKRSKREKCLGCKTITLKEVLTVFFALLIPATIGILTVVLQKNEIDISQKNRLNDLYLNNLQRQSDDQQTKVLANESVFGVYMKTMVDTILLYIPDTVNSPQYNITRILSLTALRQLSLEKKRLLVQFLYDLNFLLRGAYIFNTDEYYEDIKNFNGAILDNVDFSNQFQFIGLMLRGVSLINASFANSNLKGADFTNSILIGVDFSNTNLDGVRFVNTQLQNTNFQGASLSFAQFINVNLSQSNITDQQIFQALSIFNTILPNGTYIQNKTFIINGDAKQGTYGWNITHGNIILGNDYFSANNKTMMHQRINATYSREYADYETFDYCLSFLFHGQEKLTVQFIFLSQVYQKLSVQNHTQITSSSCQIDSSNSLEFCYWSFCDHAISTTNYIDLIFTFGNNQQNTTDIVAIKDIQFTMMSP